MTTDALSLAEALALIEPLRQENQGLRAVVAALEKRVADLMAENKALRDQLDDAQRQAARQAAPFRRRDAKKVPEGVAKTARALSIRASIAPCPRKSMSISKCRCRPAPTAAGPSRPSSRSSSSSRRSRRSAPGSLTWSLTAASAPSAARSRASSVEGPPTPPARGCSSGRRRLALAATLNKQHGLTVNDLSGSRAGRRAPAPARRAGAAGAAGRAQGRRALCGPGPRRPGLAAVFADETSWYVGGPGHWLWVFTTTTETGLPGRIEPRPTSVTGTRVRLRWCPGQRLPVELRGRPVRTHKCIAHHLKAIAEARKRPDTADPSYLDQWKLFFQTVIGFWRGRTGMSAEEFAEQCSTPGGVAGPGSATRRGPKREMWRSRPGSASAAARS